LKVFIDWERAGELMELIQNGFHEQRMEANVGAEFFPFESKEGERFD
jgi:hypothetical protein